MRLRSDKNPAIVLVWSLDREGVDLIYRGVLKQEMVELKMMMRVAVLWRATGADRYQLNLIEECTEDS